MPDISKINLKKFFGFHFINNYEKNIFKSHILFSVWFKAKKKMITIQKYWNLIDKKNVL